MRILTTSVLSTLLACVSGAMIFLSLGTLHAEETTSSPVSSPTPKPIPQQVEHTLLLIKPNAVAARHTGDILARVEACGLRIIGLKMELLSQEKAEAFYAEHAARPFYASLVRFMSSGPLVAVALEGSDAVPRLRKLLGATNPADALPGTIRADFGVSVQENAAHGSDSTSSAKRELKLVFPELNQ